MVFSSACCLASSSIHGTLSTDTVPYQRSLSILFHCINLDVTELCERKEGGARVQDSSS